MATESFKMRRIGAKIDKVSEGVSERVRKNSSGTEKDVLKNRFIVPIQNDVILANHWSIKIYSGLPLVNLVIGLSLVICNVL